MAVRNIRRKVKEELEAKVKDGDLGEDEGNRLQKELETVTKQKNDMIDQLLDAKEKEILEV